LNPALERDQAIVGFAKLLRTRFTDTLDDLPRLLRDESAQISKISKQRRVAFVKACMAVLDVDHRDLALTA
jgi:hypothetical protein